MVSTTRFLSTAILMTASANPGDEILFDFDKPEASSAWQAVNDGVMGGVSDGRFEITQDGSLRFHGTVSLENNGGFASIRSVPQERDLSKFDGILIRFKGDGKKYAFNIRTDFEIMAGSYRQSFETAKDEWQQVFFPFRSFEASAFGQVLRDAPRLNAGKIRFFGLTISDNQEGPFQIQVDWIKASPSPVTLEDRLVTVGCATCIFEMKGVAGCKLAVEIDGKHYLVKGSGIDDHGDAHEDDGLCNSSRRAVVSGKVEEGVFLSTSFKVIAK